MLAAGFLLAVAIVDVLVVLFEGGIKKLQRRAERPEVPFVAITAFFLIVVTAWLAAPGNKVVFTGALCVSWSVGRVYASSGTATIVHLANKDHDGENGLISLCNKVVVVALYFSVFVIAVFLGFIGEHVEVPAFWSATYGVHNFGVPRWLVVLSVCLLWFLTQPANAAVKALVQLAGRPEGEVLEDSLVESKPKEVFVGGRYLGPMERVIALVSLLTGAYAVVGAIFAAKGIIRFPEIQKDDGIENKAEVFLVGSISSFFFAMMAALVIVAVR